MPLSLFLLLHSVSIIITFDIVLLPGNIVTFFFSYITGGRRFGLVICFFILINARGSVVLLFLSHLVVDGVKLLGCAYDWISFQLTSYAFTRPLFVLLAVCGYWLTWYESPLYFRLCSCEMGPSLLFLCYYLRTGSFGYIWKNVGFQFERDRTVV